MTTDVTTDVTSSEQDFAPRVVFASMAGVIIVMLLAALDGTIVGTAMPRIIADLQGFQHYAAVTTAYMLSATVVVPIVGKLSDLYGRKPFLLAGVTVFLLGSALCGAATSMTGLIVFRAIQGLGGGVAQGMAFTTVADLFPPVKRGRITGLVGAVFGLASVIGPAVGGFLTDGPGWRWCFYVNLPIGIVALAVLSIWFPHRVAHRVGERRVDWAGAATLVLSAVPILLALSWGGRDYPWGSPVILSLLIGGLVMLAVFIRVQQRTPHAIMPPALFRHRVVWTAAGAATLMSLGMFGALLFIPLFIQGVVGRSASESGAVMTPMMFAFVGSSVLAGQLMSRWGRYKAIGVVGVTLTTFAMFLLSRMGLATEYRAVVMNMMVLGVGLGLTMPVFNLAVQNAVDLQHVGVATSAMQFLRSIGGSLGAAVFGAVLSSRFSSSLKEALANADTSGIAPGMLANLSNPQVLINPNVAAQLRTLDPAARLQLAPLLEAVKAALASALHDVFTATAVVAALGIVFAVLIVDLPLRRSNREHRPTAEVA